MDENDKFFSADKFFSSVAIEGNAVANEFQQRSRWNSRELILESYFN